MAIETCVHIANVVLRAGFQGLVKNWRGGGDRDESDRLDLVHRISPSVWVWQFSDPLALPDQHQVVLKAGVHLQLAHQAPNCSHALRIVFTAKEIKLYNVYRVCIFYSYKHMRMRMNTSIGDVKRKVLLAQFFHALYTVDTVERVKKEKGKNMSRKNGNYSYHS